MIYFRVHVGKIFPKLAWFRRRSVVELILYACAKFGFEPSAEVKSTGTRKVRLAKKCGWNLCRTRRKKSASLPDTPNSSGRWPRLPPFPCANNNKTLGYCRPYIWLSVYVLLWHIFTSLSKTHHVHHKAAASASAQRSSDMPGMLR